MIELNSPIWTQVYSASNNPCEWLRRLLDGDGDFQKNVDILAEDLSHQLSYYTATAYVLPHLAALCPTLSLEDEVYLIAKLGAAIAAETVGPLSPDTEAYQEFQEGLTCLQHETKLLISNPHTAVLLKDHPALGQEFALSALAILGDRSHAYGLYLLSAYCWETGHAACACGWNDEELPLAEYPDCLEPASIAPWDGKSLIDEAVWFRGLLALAGDNEISPVLPLVYGTGVCPECGRREPYWIWLNRFMEEC